MANTTNSTLNRAANDRLDSMDLQVETVGNGLYSFTLNAPYGFVINNASFKMESGTCTCAVKINSVDVTGLAAVSVTTSKVTTSATAANVVAAGARVTVTVSSAASTPTKLQGNLNITRNGSEGV